MDDIKPAAVAKLDDNTVLSRKTKKIPKKSGGGGKRKAATAALSPADLIAILPWIPRAQLEDLICSSINNNTVMTSQQLINAIPDNQKWRFNEHTGRKKKSYTPVKSGPERVDTGSFDSVDTSTMLNILTYLNCRERYVCVTEVCKGWREFKSSMPSLFLDLSDNSWSEKGRKMTASRLLDLMDWMPLSQITAFRISTQIQCNPNTCKQIVKKLVASKKKAPMITKLVLYGPKIYGSLMAELTKNEIGKTLKCLCFHDVTVNQKTKLASSIADLFRSLPFLEELYIPQSLTGNLASTVLAPLASARGGSSTLLRVLDLTTERFVYSGDRLSLFALSKIGIRCPELEVLRIVAVKGVPIFNRWETHGGVGPEIVLDSPMASMPRLREFEVRSLYASTEDVHRQLTWLLAGMPAVEIFSFGHGEKSMTRKDINSAPPLPGIVPQGRQIIWPSTLRNLSLSFFTLAADTFTDANIPSLKTLQLKKCGNNVDTIINGLHFTHPNVEVTKIESRF